MLLCLLTGTFRKAETLLDTTLQMIRNIPALALIPLVILGFGIGESAKLFLVSVGVFFPVYLNTFHGISSVDRGIDRKVGRCIAAEERASSGLGDLIGQVFHTQDF